MIVRRALALWTLAAAALCGTTAAEPIADAAAPCAPTVDSPCTADRYVPPPPLDGAAHRAIFGPTDNLAGYTVMGPVPRVAWDRTRDPHALAVELAAARRPVILTRSPCVDWPAFTLWQREEYLASHVPQLTKIYRHRERTFVYENENRRALGELDRVMPFVVGPTNYEPVTLAMRDFFDELAKPQPKPFYHYYSREIRRADNFVSLLKDLTPRAFLNIPLPANTLQPADRTPTPPPAPALSEQLLLWIGGNGTTAHTHFDTNVNYYFQLRGHKRFILSPPSEAASLYPHPHLHGCDRQSMLNFTHPDTRLRQFPLYGTARAHIADLGPGDLLLVPPLWFHKVIAKSVSVSVNVWSDAIENQLVTALNTQAVPHFISAGIAGRDAVPHKDATRLLVAYIRLLLGEVLTLSTPKARASFLRESLLKTRYKPFTKSFGCDNRSFKPERCPVAGYVDPAVSARYLDAPLRHARRLFGDARRAAQSAPGAVETLVLDFVERLVFFHSGLEHVCSFVRCMTQRGAWDPKRRPGEAPAALPGDEEYDDTPNAESEAGIPAYMPLPDESVPQRLNLDRGKITPRKA